MGRRGRKGRSVVGHNQWPKPSSNLEGVQARKRRKQDDPIGNESDESGPVQRKGTRSRVPIGPNHQAKLPDCTFGKKDGNVAEDSADSLSCLYLGSDRTENISNNQAPVRSSGLHPTDSMPTDAMPLLLTPTSGPPVDTPQPETPVVVHESTGEASTTSFDWSRLAEMGHRAVEVIQTWSNEVKRLKTIFVEEKDRNERLKTMLAEEKDKNKHLKIMLALEKDKNEHHNTMLTEEKDKTEHQKTMTMLEEGKDKNEHLNTMLVEEKDKNERLQLSLNGEEKDNNKRLKTMLTVEKDNNERLQLSFPKSKHLQLSLHGVHTRLDECIALIDSITQKNTQPAQAQVH
uniref:Uncharacterized protein n=1 Tax=Oryza punctata TaxID=4537 RepID=A0A0E0MKK2_ORYPU